MIKHIVLALIISTALEAADQFSFQVYNDFFAGNDRHFTNGIAISWLDNTQNRDASASVSAYSKFLQRSIDYIPFVDLDSNTNYTAGASISQIIVTPSDTTLSTAQYYDVPYAGYLALSSYIFAWKSSSFQEYRLEVGVMGPQAGAKEVQNSFHRMIGNSTLQGWGTQLGPEYTLNGLYRYGDISWQHDSSGYWSMDLFNHAGFELGNFVTEAFVGSMFRIGNNYIRNFNVHYPYLREEASLLKVDQIHEWFGWSFSFGLNLGTVVYSMILDKGKEEGYGTDKNFFNANIYGGLDFFYNRHKFTIYYQSQSPYVKAQNEIDILGGFMYSYQF